MEKKSNFFERLMQIIDYKGYNSLNNFAKEGLNYKSSEKLNRLKGENTSPSFEIISDITNKFEDIDANWLITGEGDMIRPVKVDITTHLSKKKIEKTGIPLYPVYAFAGFGGNDDIAIKHSDIEDYISIPRFKGKVDFYLSVDGSSMYPKYSSGDIIACKELKDRLYFQWNKCHVLNTKSQGVMVKRLLKSTDETKLICRSDNSSYEDFEVPLSDIVNVALVIGVIRFE